MVAGLSMSLQQNRSFCSTPQLYTKVIRPLDSRLRVIHHDKIDLPGEPPGIFQVDLPVVLQHGRGKAHFPALQRIMHGLGDPKKAWSP